MIPRHKHEAIVAQLKQEIQEAFEMGYTQGYCDACQEEQEPKPTEAWQNYEARLKLKP